MFVETSAKTGDGVEEAFLETARKIYQILHDGILDLSPVESGVVLRSSLGQDSSSGTIILSNMDKSKDGCNC